MPGGRGPARWPTPTCASTRSSPRWRCPSATRPGPSACCTWRTTWSPHTFTAARLKVLTLLSSQMAISLENSLLFGKLNQEIEERRRAEAKAQESVQARDEFLSIAAHELKTPLTSLTLALQVLAQETDRGGSASQVQLAQVGERQVRRLHGPDRRPAGRLARPRRPAAAELRGRGPGRGWCAACWRASPRSWPRRAAR